MPFDADHAGDPVVVHGLPHPSVTAGAQFAYRIPAGTFSDPQGQGLTYSVMVYGYRTEYDWETRTTRRWPAWLAARPDDRLAARGGKQAAVAMPIPEAATVVWTTADKQRHSETVEIRRHIEGKPWFDGSGKLSFEVDGAALRVFLVRQLPNFKEERTQIH